MTVKNRWFLIPSIVSALALIFSFIGVLSGVDWKLYDFMLNFRSEPAEYPAVLLTDFDDAALADIGSWPVGRDLIGEGLATMKELGASTAVFDIEYVDKSPRGVDARYLEEDIPEFFNEGFGSVSENIRALFSAVAQGRMRAADAGEYADDLADSTESLKGSLLESVRKVAADNDDKLGKAARFFGNAYFTINMRREPTPGSDEATKKAIKERYGKPIAPGTEHLYNDAVDIMPTIASILSRSAGAGFPNVYVDPDGVRRRIDLFYRYGDVRFGQLVMAPLMDAFGSPELEVSRSSYLLKGATLPSGLKTDIRIPRAEDGRMLINWLHGDYISSFRHLSFNEFLQYEKLFSDLAHNLRIRDDWGYLDGYAGEIPLARWFAEIQAQRRSWLEADEAPPEDAAALIRDYRSRALADADAFFDSKPETAIIEQVKAALASEGLSAETRQQYEMILSDAPEYFEKTRIILKDTIDLRERLSHELAGTFCIVGFTATGTTDIGVNPFDGEYVNVGTHAAVMNTILQRDFLDDAPWWVTGLIAVAGVFALAFVINGRKPMVEIGIGLVFTVLLGVGMLGFFVFVGVFVYPAVPLMAIFSTFLVSTIASFLRAEREKGFIRSAFSHYLSADVIKEIISDPDKLKLGGTKKHMTAIFTDIRGFSTISEKLTPEDLVRLLNQYLSKMSDVILDLQGTIDKYEGDAIIAFFGAPLDLKDHAFRACKSAAAMKRVERELNVRFLNEGTAPLPLMTRVGINTGDMVVGNMGTDRKMDYTIIGDAVNLAARLEGVNKQYGTWICVSEDTASQAGDSFIFRRLDRIRVVGKNVPIRLLELVEEKEMLDDPALRFYKNFEEALQSFENRNWKESRGMFADLVAQSAEDGPSKLYLGRCETYIEKPPVDDWDGVFNLTTK